SANERSHKAIVLKVGHQEAEIDKLLVPLIRQIWKAGIETIMSCQEVEPGICWIEFEPDQLEKFLNIIAKYEDGADTLYNRIVGELTGPKSAPEWVYLFSPHNYAIDPDDPDSYDASGPYLGAFYLAADVYFPQSDLPVLLKRLKRYNAITPR